MTNQTEFTDASVTIDLNQRRPLRRIWRYVGYDEPNYTYTPNGQALLAKLAAMSDGPYSVRCHFLLCSGDGTPALKWGSTNVYSEGCTRRTHLFMDLDRQDP
jgi:xylan 1,4-beta-xylosidase